MTVRAYCDEILTDTAGVLGSGGNSGFQALNLMIQFGVSKIVLVGFDMHLANGVHWHGKHSGKLNNPSTPTTAMWRPRFDAVAKDIANIGITVMNASATSALTAYRKIPLQEALSC